MYVQKYMGPKYILLAMSVYSIYSIQYAINAKVLGYLYHELDRLVGIFLNNSVAWLGYWIV